MPGVIRMNLVRMNLIRMDLIRMDLIRLNCCTDSPEFFSGLYPCIEKNMILR